MANTNQADAKLATAIASVVNALPGVSHFCVTVDRDPEAVLIGVEFCGEAREHELREALRGFQSETVLVSPVRRPFENLGIVKTYGPDGPLDRRYATVVSTSPVFCDWTDPDTGEDLLLSAIAEIDAAEEADRTSAAVVADQAFGGAR